MASSVVDSTTSMFVTTQPSVSPVVLIAGYALYDSSIPAPMLRCCAGASASWASTAHHDELLSEPRTPSIAEFS